MVLLLYTSHNSPSHQHRTIIYLGDDVSIRVCQTLTAALWVVVFQESIVNQDNIKGISLAGGHATLGLVEAFHQMTAQPEHIQEKVLGHVSLSPFVPRFPPPPHLSPANPTQRHTRIHRSDKARRQKHTQRQTVAKGGVPVTRSSPVSALHQRYEQPVRVCKTIWWNLQSPKHSSGAFSKNESRWLPSLEVPHSR